MDKRAIVQRALENVNHPLSEITGRTKFRGHSPTVAPVTGIKMALPKTSTMAKKMQKVLDDETPEGRKKQKRMANLVIGREENDKEILLQFKTAASREKFRKLMNEEVYNGHSVEDIKEAVAADPQGMVKGLSNKAKKEIADELNRMQLSGYGDYEASPKNVHKFRPADLMAAMIKIMKLESLDEEKSLFDISPTSSKWMKGKLRVGYNQSQKSGMPKEMFKKGQVIDLHPFDGDRFVGAKSPKDKGSYFFVAKRHVDAMKEDVKLDEGTMNFLFDSPLKAGAFAQRIMRDKLASEVDRYVDHGKRKEVVELITHPNNYEKNDILKLAKKYKGTVHSVEEDVQLDETNFRFPQPGEDYGDLTKSISDPSGRAFPDMSRDELRKRSRDIERKFAVMMRKHKGTKVGEVLDLLDKDGNTKVHQDNDIKLIKRYLTKFKDNVRKVAHQMMIDFMEGDDYLAKKRIPVREDVQLDETMTARDLESMIKGLKRGAKQEIADALNDMNLGGYGDYEARVDNIHKFKTKDLFNAMKKVMRLESLTEEKKVKARVGFIAKKPRDVVRDLRTADKLNMFASAQEAPGSRTDIFDITFASERQMNKFMGAFDVMLIDMLESKMQLDERAMTYVIDRRSKEIVYGPTDTGDAKLYLKKQIQPRKLMIRQIRGDAKKVGDKV